MIDLSNHGTGQLRWCNEPVHGQLGGRHAGDLGTLMAPPATTRCALVLCEEELLMVGGALCTPASGSCSSGSGSSDNGGGGSSGGEVRLATGVYALNANCLQWAVVPLAAAAAPARGRRTGGATTATSAAAAAAAASAAAVTPPTLRFGHAAHYSSGKHPTLYLTTGSASPHSFASVGVTEAIRLQVSVSPIKPPPPQVKTPPLGCNATAAAAAATAASPMLLPRAPSLAADLREFCCSEWMSDVTLVVRGVPLPAHRIILCAASRRFYILLQPPCSSSRAADQVHAILKVRPRVLLVSETGQSALQPTISISLVMLPVGLVWLRSMSATACPELYRLVVLEFEHCAGIVY